MKEFWRFVVAKVSTYIGAEIGYIYSMAFVQIKETILSCSVELRQELPDIENITLWIKLIIGMILDIKEI